MFRRPILLSVLFIAALALPPAASAGPLVADAPDCAARDASKVFSPWADLADYVLIPGGAAESGRGWSLSSGASIVPGSEPFAVHSVTDRKALRLAPGASATSATVCVGVENPVLRFFTASDFASGSVQVEVLFETAAGDVDSVVVGGVVGGGWSPTLPMPVVANLLPLLPGNHTPVRFRFTSTGSGAITLDDVYVDPWMRG
ncbi:MAG: hypothetical protein ABIO51_06970 [Solirubrobacteraceae bacterium]